MAQAWAGAAAPLFGLINAAFALALVFTLFSLVTQHAVFGIALPSSVPLWAGILIVIAIYQVIALPFIAMQRAAVHPYAPGPLVWISPFAGLLWLGVVAFSIWYGYHHVPAVHEFIDAVLAAWQKRDGRPRTALTRMAARVELFRDLIVQEHQRDDAAVEVPQIELLVLGARRLRRLA